MLSNATIAGKPVSAIGPIAWVQTTGTQPYITTIQVHQSEADHILRQQGQPVSIVVKGEGGVEEQFAYVICRAPSTAPYYVGITFADVRWLWQRVHILRRFNIPRRTGSKRILEGQLVEVQGIEDNYTYADWSLNGRKRWTGKEVLENVLKAATALGGAGYDISACPNRDISIESLELDDPADSALARALAFVPGAGVYVEQGKVIVYDTLDLTGTAAAVKKMTPPIMGAGIVAEVLQKALRPSKFEVLFNREVELRIDATTETEEEEGTQDPAADNGLTMRNVGPSTDLDLVVAGQHLYRGTWARIAALLDAWGTGPLGGVAGAITLDGVRRNWFYGLWNSWSMAGARSPDADWVARLSMLRQHFRQTYRLNPRWARRLRSLRGHRVAVIDPQSGSRAPALVMSNYAVQMGDKARWIGATSGSEFFLWENVEGYPTDGLLTSGKPAPALVQIVDEDLGIFRLHYLIDPTRRADSVHPSMVVNESGETGTPCHDLRYQGLKQFSCVDDGRVKGTQAALELSPEHRALVVLTAAPAAPNNERQLHKITITPNDLADMVEPHAAGGSGPTWQVRVSPALLTARISWDDDQADLYPRIFGFNSQNPDDAGVDSEEITGDIFQNQAECRAVAKAVCAAILTKLADHYSGQQAVHTPADLKITGNMDSVLRSLDASGALSTTFRLTPELKAQDLFAFLPSGMRTIILNMVQFKNP